MLKVALIVLGVLVGLVLLALVVPLLQDIDMVPISRVYKARADIRVLSAAIAKFQEDKRQLPVSLARLEGTYVRKVPNDPWGRPYSYTANVTAGTYELLSLGADGIAGGRGECTDFNSSTDLEKVIRQIHWHKCKA